MQAPFPTFVNAVPLLDRVTDDAAHATVRFEPDEPVLVGHYPGHPIVPGVCLLELVHLTVRQLAARGGLTAALSAIKSARFVNPVDPGTDLDIAVGIERGATNWRINAVVATPAGRAATAVIDYEVWIQ